MYFSSAKLSFVLQSKTWAFFSCCCFYCLFILVFSFLLYCNVAEIQTGLKKKKSIRVWNLSHKSNNSSARSTFPRGMREKGEHGEKEHQRPQGSNHLIEFHFTSLFCLKYKRTGRGGMDKKNKTKKKKNFNSPKAISEKTEIFLSYIHCTLY